MISPDCSPVRCLQVSSWKSEEIVNLYRSAGWWLDTYDPAHLPALIQGSFIFALAIEEIGGRAVAMGRILSDGVTIGYVQDLCVLPEFQGRSIGRFLLRFLIRTAFQKGVARIRLVAEPGTRHFYEQSGFIQDGELRFYSLPDTGCTDEN